MRRGKQRFILLRHGETTWSLSKQRTSSTAIPLTENGRAVARGFAPVLAEENLEQVLSSPLQRAGHTCELAGLGAQATVDEDLVDRSYGEYEDMTPQPIRANAPELLIFRDRCLGGEAGGGLRTG